MAKASLFVRDRSNTGTITKRDTQFVRYAERYRFIETDHFVLLSGHSYRPVAKRLKLLFDNGYLDRPKSQDDRTRHTGSKTIVYALGNKGADLLADVDGIQRKRVDWTDKNNTIKNFSIKHTLMATDFFVWLKIACDADPNVRLVEQAELEKHLRPQFRRLTKLFKWRVRAQIPTGENETIGIDPDGTFALDFLTEKKRNYFFAEFDRSTMPLESSNPKRSSIVRKFIGYDFTAKQKLHTEHFGWRNFRVLFLAISAERAENMLKKQSKILKGHGTRRFLFAEASGVNNENILSAEWLNGFSEPARLSDI